MPGVIVGKLDSGRCSANNRVTRARRTQVVVFQATQATDVRLDFGKDPFDSPRYTYFIGAGRALTLRVRQNAESGEHRYGVSCGKFTSETEGREDEDVAEIDTDRVEELLEELEETLGEGDLTDPVMIFIES